MRPDPMPLPQDPAILADHFADAWNQRDAAALAALFAEDADFVNVVGLWWHNRADIRKAHHYGLTTFFARSSLVARRVKTRLITDKIATIHVRWRLSGQTGLNGEVLEDRFTVMSFVAEWRQNRWLVLSAQNTDIVSGAETFVAQDGTLQAADYR